LCMSHIRFKLRRDIQIEYEDAIYDATIYLTGRMNAKFSAKMTKLMEAKLIQEMITGCFVGSASSTFEPIDEKMKA